MITLGVVWRRYIVFAGATCPSGATGDVGPKPVPVSTMVSPGLAGTVVMPTNTPFLTAMVESRWFATTYDGGHLKNAGERVDIRTSMAGTVFVPPTIRISPGPGMMSSGIRALIWVGLTRDTGAASPLTVTPTPLRLVGRKPPTMSVGTNERVVEARLVPMIENQEFGEIKGPKLAAFSTFGTLTCLLATVMMKAWLLDNLVLSVTCTVKEKLPAVVGIPPIVPEADTDKPGGSVPERRDQVYGAVPLVAARVCA